MSLNVHILISCSPKTAHVSYLCSYPDCVSYGLNHCWDRTINVMCVKLITSHVPMFLCGFFFLWNIRLISEPSRNSTTTRFFPSRVCTYIKWSWTSSKKSRTTFLFFHILLLNFVNYSACQIWFELTKMFGFCLHNSSGKALRHQEKKSL